MDNRDAAQQKAFDAILRRSLAVERNTRGMVADMNKVIEDAGRALGIELQDRLDNLTPAELQAITRYRTGQRIDKLPTRVQGVIKHVDKWAADLNAAILAAWGAGARDFIRSEADFAQDLMKAVLVEAPAAAMSANAIYRTAMETPVLGKFIEDGLRGVSQATRGRVYDRVREGLSQGQTNAEIVRSLRGTKTMNFRDGILKTTRNELQSIVRTGRSHLSNVTYDETYRALGVEEVVFVATIDGRTTFRCSDLDSKVYSISDNYPRPPLHWGCRSVIAPYFGGRIAGNRPYVKAFEPIQRIPKDERPEGMIGQVRASTSMEQFLRRPDNAAFARRYFGEQRYKLFKENKLTIGQMVRADGTKYSLDELRQRHRQDFRELFG